MSMVKELLIDMNVSEAGDTVPDLEETDCADLSKRLKDLDDEYSSFEDLRYDE